MWSSKDRSSLDWRNRDEIWNRCAKHCSWLASGVSCLDVSLLFIRQCIRLSAISVVQGRLLIDRKQTNLWVSSKSLRSRRCTGVRWLSWGWSQIFQQFVCVKNLHENAENKLWVCCQRFVDKWPGQGKVFSLQVLRCIAYSCGWKERGCGEANDWIYVRVHTGIGSDTTDSHTFCPAKAWPGSQMNKKYTVIRKRYLSYC